VKSYAFVLVQGGDVTAAAREKVSWDRWNNNSWRVTLGFQDRFYSLNQFFKKFRGITNYFATEVDFAITFGEQ
jgi:hypothetical protein